jgi:hypothetical protein
VRYLPVLLALICLVLLFVILGGSQDDWIKVGRKLTVVIAGFILLAIVFGLVLARTITS